MNYFLPVLQFLFLLIQVSSKQCRERNEIQVTGGVKESSQNGYFYGMISTPNFPNPFTTPFNFSWVIDASHHDNGTQINIYLTQMYLSKGVRFFQRPTYKFCDDHARMHGRRQECRKAEDQMHAEIFVDKLSDVLRVSTTCPYLEIQVTVPTLYGYHYRTRDKFLFDVYGFNITYEIVPERVGVKNDSCYPRNCSYLGHCYLADNWEEFFCDCIKNHRGRHCEYSSELCDPENNVTFCFNGGKCRVISSGDGYCDCEGTGYNGARCEKKIEPKVSARKGCTSPSHCPPAEEKDPVCTLEQSPGPCSCRPSPRSGRKVPPDWVKYEAVISISPNFTTQRNQSSVELEMRENITSWLDSKFQLSMIQNFIVRFHPPREPRGDHHPREIFMNFQGPLKIQDRVRVALKDWFNDRSSFHFRRQIPLLRDTFKIYTMPRVKYKSIEDSKITRLRIGNTVSLTCFAITGQSKYVASNDIRFRWFKDGLPVNCSIATRHMTIGKTPTNDNETMSILMIHEVSAFDGGLYTCEVTDLEFGDQECGQKSVEVTLPPQIEVEPMSLTLEKKKLERGAVILCTDGSKSAYNPHNKSTEFVWSRSGSGTEVVNDGVVVLEDINPQGKMLRILSAEHSESFICHAFNKDGEERKKIVEVRVLESKNAPSCRRHWEKLAKSDKESLMWEWTAPNQLAMIPCPRNFIGYVQRQCILSRDGMKAYWGRSDFSRCISDYLSKLNRTLQNAKRGFGDWRMVNGVKLLTQVERYVNANKIFYPGEGEKITSLVEDIVKYAFHSGRDKGLFEVFFRIVLKLLTCSCVHERSVKGLSNIILDVAVRGAMQTTNDDGANPIIQTSDVLMLQTLPIKSNAKYRDLSYMFPQRERIMDTDLPPWLSSFNVVFPLDSRGFRSDVSSSLPYYLTMAAYKNLSSILVPPDVPPYERSGTTVRASSTMNASRKNIHSSIELISPVIQIAIPDSGYTLSSDSHIKIQFNLSKEVGRASAMPMTPQASSFPPTMKGIFLGCGVLAASGKSSTSGLRWALNDCTTVMNEGMDVVECQCKSLGIFGLLRVSNVEDEIPEMNNDISRIVFVGFSFCIMSCVLSATSLCIYLRCHVSPNSLYFLKILDCFFVFSAVFIILLQLTEGSSLLWSSIAGSLLLASLSTNCVKVMRILMMEAGPHLREFIFPWLRNVSQFTLLSAITFSTILPVWTLTVAKMIGGNSSVQSAFDESSHVFPVFFGIFLLVALVFLFIYYRAYLKTRRELDECRQQTNPCAKMIWVLTYRMKTLNRSLCLTLVLVVMTLTIILYGNLRNSVSIQWCLGISATIMGITIFMAYVSHCEYPLCINLCGQSHPEKPLRCDPEKEEEKSGSRRKLYAISSDISGNDSIVGTTGLLPQPIQSETLSVSTVEEQSTFSTELSFRQTVELSNLAHKAQPINMNNKRPRVPSTGNNTISSSAGSYRSRKLSDNGSTAEKQMHAPKRAKCLLARDTGEYIMPSGTTTTTATTIPAAEPSSVGSCNGYLTIRDHDLQNKKYRMI